MKKILICVLVLILVLAFSSTALAVGNISGIQRSRDGTFYWSGLSNQSHDEITQAMTYGEMLFTDYDSKAVALVNQSVYCTVDRVRCYPMNYTYPSPIDLRIDPNSSSNWVGPSKTNGVKQVKAVQTILYFMEYLDDESDVDGICGPGTIQAIKDFQAEHGFATQDGIVGSNTWRALCSSSGYQYGVVTW